MRDPIELQPRYLVFLLGIDQIGSQAGRVMELLRARLDPHQDVPCTDAFAGNRYFGAICRIDCDHGQYPGQSEFNGIRLDEHLKRMAADVEATVSSDGRIIRFLHRKGNQNRVEGNTLALSVRYVVYSSGTRISKGHVLQGIGPGAEFIDYFNASLMPGIEMSGGFARFEPGGRLPDHLHDFDESICIIAGDANCLVEGRKYSLSDCATAMVPRGRVHYFVNDSSDPMDMIWVYAGPMPLRIVIEPVA